MTKENEKEGAGVYGVAGPGDNPPRGTCGSRHSHKSAAQAVECDQRLAMRKRHKLDVAARREAEAAPGWDWRQKR